MRETFPKQERLCGKTTVEALFTRGKSGQCGCVRYRFLPREGEGPSRLLVSVPKRSFKRAVKRNLLKRRIREAYRRLKGGLPASADILFIYVYKDILPYADIYSAVEASLKEIGEAL